MKYKIIFSSVVLGFFIWIAYAFFDFFLFDKGSFWEALIYDVPIHEIYMRSIIVISFLLFGLITAKLITRHIKTQDKLKETKDYLDNLIDSSLDCIVLADNIGNIVRANESFLQLIGYQFEEIKGKRHYLKGSLLSEM